MNPTSESIMIATLGGQPQVVTFALDALLARGERIREVIVLYLAVKGRRGHQALAKLAAEFADDQYDGRPCRLRPMPLRDGAARLADIQNENHAIATWEMLRDLLTRLKSEHYHLHICLSGGRRMVALLMVSVALLHFGYRDKLWHIYTPDRFQEQARNGVIMHAQPENGVCLIEVPLVPLGTQFPALKTLLQGHPADFSQAPPAWLNVDERARCRAVIEQLTPRQLETLRAFASGLSPQQVADQMGITLNTVNSHKKTIFELCRNAWPSQETLRYYHLREWFGPYFGLL